MPSKKVLVADDHSDTRVICRELLTHYGYIVLEAADGVEAVGLATLEYPDLILLDYLMPPVGGLETLKQLRAIERMQATPIVLYTAAATHANELNAVEGIQCVLFKPVEAVRLLSVVRELIGDAS